MKSIYQEFLQIIHEKMPKLQQDMFPGCSVQEIDNYERELELTLPNQYKELLKTYNGEKCHKGVMAFSFMSVGEAFGQYKRILNGPANFLHSRETNFYQPNLLQPFYYSKKRLPIAYDGSGNSICIDYEPNLQGEIGQIVYLPLGDPEPMSVIATNFDDFLAFIISSIKSERLVAHVIHEIDEDGEYLEAYFYKTWLDDWTDIADEFNQRGNWN